MKLKLINNESGQWLQRLARSFLKEGEKRFRFREKERVREWESERGRVDE